MTHITKTHIILYVANQKLSTAHQYHSETGAIRSATSATLTGKWWRLQRKIEKHYWNLEGMCLKHYWIWEVLSKFKKSEMVPNQF